MGVALMADLDKDTVDFVDNYDSTMKEPTLLPATFPNVLVTGHQAFFTHEAMTAIAGITLVLGLVGPGSHTGAQISLAGIGWGMGAAVCAACYFVMSDKASADGTGLHSVTLATGGLIVGAAAVALLGVSGVMPLTFTR